MLGRMRSLANFHPDLRVAALVAPRRAVTPRTLPVLRRLTKAIKGTDPDVHVLEPGVAVRYFRPHTLIDGRESGMSRAEPRPALLWIHGGGYVFGRAAQDDACVSVSPTDSVPSSRRSTTARAGVPLSDPGERLLPGLSVARASAGGGRVEDCDRWCQCWWRSRRRTGVRHPRQRPHGAGVSASGLSDARRPDCVRTRAHAHVGRGLQPLRVGEFPRRCRCFDCGARTSNRLAGLPPAWIGVGSNDLFASEDREYADRLVEAGVPCEFRSISGAFHGFDLVSSRSGVAREFFDEQCVAVSKILKA